jgi:hypothetical protein
VHHAIGKIEYFLTLTLDVACCIGQSTVGLKRTTECIVGADPSMEFYIYNERLQVSCRAYQ